METMESLNIKLNKGVLKRKKLQILLLLELTDDFYSNINKTHFTFFLSAVVPVTLFFTPTQATFRRPSGRLTCGWSRTSARV